jgi:hypothetical protein
MGSNVATFALAQQQNAIMLAHTFTFIFKKFSSSVVAEDGKRKRLLEVNATGPTPPI